MSEMVEAKADWLAPDQADVDQQVKIGLSIGDSAALKAQIDATLPKVPTVPAGKLYVGTDVSAELIADPLLVTVKPDVAINASTGSEIGLLWAWTIHTLQPADQLELTAHITMTIPGTTHQLIRDLNFFLSVKRTIGYTANQVFTSWATWAGIAGSVAAVMGWLWKRRNRPAAQRAPTPSARNGNAGEPRRPRPGRPPQEPSRRVAGRRHQDR